MAAERQAGFWLVEIFLYFRIIIPKNTETMSCLRAILCIIFPPLAVIDKGCGSVILVFALTLCAWVPGVIGAILICNKQ